MKIIPGCRKRHYLARVSIFLVIITLVVGVAGCGNSGGGDGDYYYDLDIASTVGGSVVEPGEGDFDYAANTTVDLVAEADEHYHFVNWTGDVATIGNVTSAATKITMYSDYSIAANFELDEGWYSLTISGEGGSVITPGEGIFVYAANTTVDLVAESDEGYPFLKWADDVGTVTDVQAAATNITMHDSYSITAHFGIQIWDWHDLDAMRDNLGGRYYLMTDVDSTTAGYTEIASPTANDGKGWEPIGTVLDDPFTGTFDGQGYEICDLFIYRPDENYPTGLFGWAISGVFRDVGLLNVTVTGSFDIGVGSLVGFNGWGTVNNCYSTGSVAGGCGVGGLVGGNGMYKAARGTVTNSYSTASVTGNVSVGGLVGSSKGPVSNSYSTGDVTGNWNVGGLVGESYALISNSHSSGIVTGSSSVGGLVGVSGYPSGVNRCYSTGSVTGHKSVGGLVGNSGGVSNSYSTGSVNGDEEVGGLVGYCDISGSVSNSYSTGSVTGNKDVGGLVGLNKYNNTVSNSFWDVQTSGQATSDGGTGKTTADMKIIATFSGAAWDIIAVAPGSTNTTYTWNIVNTVTYPFLSWQS